MVATRTLPKKRSPEEEAEDFSTKKSKAEIRRQSLAKAKEWADRKRKTPNDGVDGDEARKSAPVKKTTKRRGASKTTMKALMAEEDDNKENAVSVDEVFEDADPPVAPATVRRSSRRRTMSAIAANSAADTFVATGTVNKATTKKAPTTTRKSSRRKTVTPKDVEVIKEEEPEEVQTLELKRAASEEEEEEVIVAAPEVVVNVEENEEVVVEAKPEEKVEVVQEEKAAEDSVAKEVERDEDIAVDEETKEEAVNDVEHVQTYQPTEGSSFEGLAAFLHCLINLWTLAFAAMLSVGFDWFVQSQFTPFGVMGAEVQRAPCFMLSLWLVSIVIASVAFGPRSRAGWVVTQSSLVMASISTKKLMAFDSVSVPTLPIVSFDDVDINVPDALVVLCLIGLASALKWPATVGQDKAPTPVNSDVVTEKSVQIETSDPIVEAGEEEAGSGGKSFIGQRVAVERGLDVLPGTVKEFDPDKCQWVIQFDDGFQEEERLNRIKLGSAFKLHSKHLSDNLRDMWRAGEL